MLNGTNVPQTNMGDEAVGSSQKGWNHSWSRCFTINNILFI